MYVLKLFEELVQFSFQVVVWHLEKNCDAENVRADFR